jgi:hypothetical protein
MAALFWEKAEQAWKSGDKRHWVLILIVTLIYVSAGMVSLG